MSLRFHASFAFVLLLALPLAARACLWDYDTLKQERARFPTRLELITGKFPRHSREFYEWRIRDRSKKLESDPHNLAYHDDLAVAYEKTGQHDKAIATMLAKDKIKPGVYETYSNLGTFHILAGDFEKGLPYIDKALAINPDAHFGREKYQKWLVEYALTKRNNGVLKFPLQAGADQEQKTFDSFVAKQLGRDSLTTEQSQAATQGVLGMMRFANHDNPLLLEALGDLLSAPQTPEKDAKQLAARAYLQASYVLDDAETQAAYRDLARNVLEKQLNRPSSKQLTLEEVEDQLVAELATGEQWYANLQAQELQWIREGKDADAEYDRFLVQLEGRSRLSRVGVPIAAIAALVVAAMAGLFVLWRRRARVPSASARVDIKGNPLPKPST